MRLRLETSFKKHEKFNGYTFEARVPLAGV